MQNPRVFPRHRANKEHWACQEQQTISEHRPSVLQSLVHREIFSLPLPMPIRSQHYRRRLPFFLFILLVVFAFLVLLV